MNWFEWTLVFYFILNGLAAVGLVGKPRDPITPGVAVGTVVVYAALVAGVVMT